MTVADFVSHLQSLDVRLSAEGERLRLNAPQGVLTPSLRSQIAECKQELLEFLRHHDHSVALIPPPILRRKRDEPVPLSFAQERLWFLEQLDAGSAVYNICRAWRVTGNLNVDALQWSLNRIVQRQQVLRSAIRVVDGRPVQVIQPPRELKLSVVDLKAMSEAVRQTEMRKRIQQAAETPFDFTAGKFLRAELLRIRDDEHVLILTTHHIVSDAWSMGILSSELWSLYKTYAAGKSSDLQKLPIQYADFAVWQREWLQERVLGSHVSYWKKQLNDLPILNLPNDRPRPLRQSFTGAKMSITFSKSLTAAINDLSNERGVTPFMTLLAAFQVLLYRYSGQEDIVVGSPIANRCVTELEQVIGLFVNTLVLRVALSGNPTFEELLSRVREVCLAGYEHQDLPFEKLVRELEPERDQSRNPLFQVMFALQNATQRFSPPAGLVVEPIESETGRSLFDLSLFLRERGGRYIGYFEYSADLFDAPTVERMAGHLRTVLEGIVAGSDQRISMLPLLSDAERHQLLIEWNDTAADYPKDKCIHQLFEEQVEKTPDAVAVLFERQQITYRELNTRANQLAHYLRRLDVGPEVLVGICVERSMEMVVGLLGILKAGGAYVPLDPAYPRERLDFMLKDAQVLVVVTQDKFLQQLQESASRARYQLVCLDRDRQAIERQPESTPRTAVRSNNLAYIIYTSGSTGTPKGVEIEHRSVINCLHSIGRSSEVTKSDVLLAVTTISFDIAGLELYLPLMVAGKIVLANREETLDGRLLLKRLKDSAASVMQATPSTWRLLLEAGWEGPSDLKIFCGGEALSRQLADQLLARGTAVWNCFGPTETTIWSTAYQILPDESQVPIGRPMANTEIYIVDARQQLVPIGVAGELHIGGTGVARGYLHQSDLTTDKFIPNPFSDETNSRLYRTGDLARYLTDGNIEFVGRIDNQVKIRGHRVELAEIEAALNRHPSVKDSVVVARGSSEDKDLIGYVVPKLPSALHATELRSFLGAKLPEYMIPLAFMMLEHLPLTLNGKIDRNMLPPPGDTRPEFDTAYVGPRTQVEELLTQLWEEVLRIEVVGIYDNFFQLGGHSLLAIQIVSRAREAFDKDVSVSALFDAPTVAGLAATIEKKISGKSNELPPIVRVTRDDPLPLSMNQEHLWRLDQMIPGTHLFNMPYVYLLSGDLNVGALERALREIVRRHEALRTVFSCCKGKPLQIVNPLGNFRLSIIDLRLLKSDAKSDEAARLIVEERTRGFDLGRGPLLRTKLVQLTATKSLLLLTLHHIISDQSSVRIIREELMSLYAAFCRKEESPLPEPQIQFADYAVWEGKLLQEGLLNHQVSYWKEQLSRSSTEMALQKPRPSFYFCRERMEFDVDLFTKMRAFADAGVYTPFMIMIATLSVVIHWQTKNRQIRIGTLLANRGKRETGVLIGYLTNTVILRIEISPDMTLDELLTCTRRVTLQAFAHEELPFEYLARTMEKEQNSQGALLFEALLIYQRNSPQRDETLGLKFAPLEINEERVEAEVIMSKVPLILRLRETSTTLTGTVNYKIDSFSSTEMVRIRTGIDTILRKMVSESIRSVSVGSLVSLL